MALHDGQVLPRLQVPRYDRVVTQAPLGEYALGYTAEEWLAHRVWTQRVTQYKVCLITPSYFAASCGWYIYVMWWLMGDRVTHMMVERGELEGPEDGAHI